MYCWLGGALLALQDRRSISIATGNMHKVEELNQVLASCGYRVVPASIPKIEIQSNRLEEVAVVAASTAYTLHGKPVVVEDAGLFVEALNGFPGPYSSYVYRTIGVEGLLRLMEGISSRRAYFYSVIALAHSGGVEVYTGRVDGVIASRPRGSGGFGFDPVFIPNGSEKTFAEMSVEEKNAFSHRARAARKLCERLRETPL